MQRIIHQQRPKSLSFLWFLAPIPPLMGLCSIFYHEVVLLQMRQKCEVDTFSEQLLIANSRIHFKFTPT
jgi:hypothetical protein